MHGPLTDAAWVQSAGSHGVGVGAAVGAAVGVADGAIVGAAVGPADGAAVGLAPRGAGGAGLQERSGCPRQRLARPGDDRGAVAIRVCRLAAPDEEEAAIRQLATTLGEPILLLGGPEDTARNATLSAALGPLVEETPTDQGLLVSLSAPASSTAVIGLAGRAISHRPRSPLHSTT